MYKLTFFVLDSHLESVKQALFKAGAGQLGNYAECCWQVKGTGQFRPLDGSTPHIGELGELETTEEWKVEMLVSDEKISQVIKELKQAHPFEVPAYDVIKIVDI